MFHVARPDRSTIDKFIESARTTEFTYAEIGETRGEHSASKIPGGANAYNIDHNIQILGNGEATFERAKEAIRSWKMFDMPWIDLCWPDAPIEEGQTVAVLIRHFGFYSLNAARIVYTLDEPDDFGFAYGTLESHGESGEERFSVRFDRESGDVI